MFVRHLACTECGETRAPDTLHTLCTDCTAPLRVDIDLARAGAALTRDTFMARRGGMWRLRELLPLPADGEPVTLAEGDTPLIALKRLGAELGFPRLLLKDESRNPTGSFKDRGMSAAVSMARYLGARALAAPSAGNAGGALAAYGARAGLPVVVAMPTDVPHANRLEAEICGATVHLIPGTIADCGAWLRERGSEGGWFDLSTLKEPYRVEGKKTMAYELAEQLDWQLPEWIFYPTGGGTGLLGMAKAFREMRELGWLGPDVPDPRFVAVQAAGCAPIVDALEAGQEQERGVPPAEPFTVASGLRVPTPVGDRWMLRELREGRGLAVKVDDATLVEATRELARAEGIFAAPEVGALVAAVRQVAGELRPDDRIVLFGTGTGLKYAECFE